MKLNKKYFLVAILLIVIVFIVSIILYPSWKDVWYLLFIPVIVGVVGFIADFRQAFTEGEKENLPDISREHNTKPENHFTDIEIEETEIHENTFGDRADTINKINNQINQKIIFPSTAFTASFSGNVPPPPSLIIGRSNDIQEMKKRLLVASNQYHSLHVIAAIKGWPGVGKTTLASALAYDPEIKSLFPDGVLWVSLGQEPDVIEAMANWGRSLGSTAIQNARSIEEAQGLLAGLLKNKRLLLIVDDVWKAENAIPFNVGGAGCAVLLTTRLDSVAVSLAPTASHIYRLKVLEDKDALELVQHLAPGVVEKYPEECMMLVQELEGLPLALQVAGRLLNAEENYGFNITTLITDLRNGAKLLEAKAPSDRTDLVNETTPTIAALLQKSLDYLDEKTLDCYAYLGVFAPKPATFDMKALKTVWQVNDPNPIIKTLVDRGLLEFLPNINRYRMHAILVLLAKSLLTED